MSFIARSALPAAIVAAVLLLTACAPESGPTGDPTGSATPKADATAEPSPDPVSSPDPVDPMDDPAIAALDFSMCEPAEGKKVTELEDEVIPAQEIPEVRGEDFEFDGETVEGPVIPAAWIGERRAEAGCLVEYEPTAAGCLPAREISPAYITGYTIPERVLPATRLPNGDELEEIVLQGAEVPSVTVEGVRVDEVCQVEPGEGRIVSSVIRPAIMRSALAQTAAMQAAAMRSAESIDDNSIPSVSVGSVSAGPQSLEHVSVESESLDSYLLPDTEGVEKGELDETAVYTTQGDVLFDFDQTAIRPEAEASLAAILADIRSWATDPTLTIEGHTDDVDTPEYNLDLSLRRAEAVKAWFVAQGVDAARITTIGHGEAVPRADNSTEEGRAQNRRVVIAAQG